MPLNSHSYLVAQGWQGTGNALREGAISRPVMVARKKTLAGVGKDRDEAFPFWDHVFTAMATSINVKLSNDDSDEDTDVPQLSGPSAPLDRTSTGILSSKPQKAGLPALEAPAPQSARPTIMALAKKERARRGLYSRFFRGPVLGPETEAGEPVVLEAVRPRAEFNELQCSILTAKKKGKKRKFREEDGKVGVAQKGRKPKGEDETKSERKERRRMKRSRRAAEKEVHEIQVEGSVQDSSDVGYSGKKDRKKKLKDGENVAHRGG